MLFTWFVDLFLRILVNIFLALSMTCLLVFIVSLSYSFQSNGNLHKLATDSSYKWLPLLIVACDILNVELENMISDFSLVNEVLLDVVS